MKCPYCGSEVERSLNSYPLSVKQAKVFKMIVEAGQDGVSIADLRSSLFRGNSYITVRTSIHYINKKIAPLRILSNGKVYRINRVG